VETILALALLLPPQDARDRLAHGPGRTVFYEVPVRSTHVCFVIDRSRSMRQDGRFQAAREELRRLLDERPDGEATEGRLVDGELVARVVARRARFLRPVIHTVSLSSDAMSLKLLAELTGGEYRTR
jgi:hypothetical protein